MAGEYRAPLAAGLELLEQEEMAQQVELGDIKLALCDYRLQGPVVEREDLREVFIEALQARKTQIGDEHLYSDYVQGLHEDVCNKYINGLKDHDMVPVVSSSAHVVYVGDRTVRTNKPLPQEHYAPGELFFSS